MQLRKEFSYFTTLLLVSGFPLGPFRLPFKNMHKGLVHDVTHCYNLGEKGVPPYLIKGFLHTNEGLPPYCNERLS